MNKYFIIPLSLFIILCLTLPGAPAEDAHIMFRYAQNLSQGNGLVWNAGEQPVEGATEFLWTVLLIPSFWIGVQVGVWAQHLAMLFAILTMWELYDKTPGLFLKSKIKIGLVPSSVFAVSMISVQAVSGFGTALFSYLLLKCFTKNLLLPYRKSTYIYFLLLCLARPEGLIFAMVIIFIKQYERKLFLYGVRRSIALYFVIPLAAYFILRWMYYGYPFPNSFYAKSGGIYDHNGLDSTINFYAFCLPLFGIMIYGLRHVYGWKKHLILFVVLFPCLYLYIEQSQNIGYRFQFSILPVVLYITAEMFCFTNDKHRTTLTALVFLWTLVVGWDLRSGKGEVYDERVALGESIKDLKGTMVATEAGILPFYSGWKAYDPVGLVDEKVAHEGLTQDWIANINPDMIMFHAYTCVPNQRWSDNASWNDMVDTLYRYATTHGYVVGAITGMPWDCRWYLVRRSYKHAEALMFELGSMKAGFFCFNNFEAKYNPKIRVDDLISGKLKPGQLRKELNR